MVDDKRRLVRPTSAKGVDISTLLLHICRTAELILNWARAGGHGKPPAPLVGGQSRRPTRAPRRTPGNTQDVKAQQTPKHAACPPFQPLHGTILHSSWYGRVELHDKQRVNTIGRQRNKTAIASPATKRNQHTRHTLFTFGESPGIFAWGEKWLRWRP